MSNHHRGLWGYHGVTAGARELTVQATGIGGPSAVVVAAELAQLGMRRAIRVGSGSAREAGAALGEAVVVEAALACDGASAALGFPPGSRIGADPELTDRLARAVGRPAETVRSRDLHPGAEGRAPGDGRRPETAAVEDLQTAALLASCRRLGVAAAALLAVAVAGARRLEDEPLERVHLDLAAAATTAFSQA